MSRAQEAAAMMHRTQILFEEEQYRQLKAASERTGRSIGAIVREAVTEHLEEEVGVDDFLRALAETHGEWRDRDFCDGVEFVEQLRAGMAERLSDAAWD